jgi:acylphosphatase
MIKQINCIVSGRVQGVLYRDFSRRAARRLGVVGTVENLPDGTVSVIAQGDELKLKQYLEQLKRGSIFSHVKDIKVEWSGTDLMVLPDFQIKYRNFSGRF